MHVPRPRPWDALIALAGAAALVGEGIHRGTGSAAVAIPLALLACLPLAWSSQAPLAALLGVAAGLLICVPVFQPYDTAVFVLAVALFNVARLGDRRRSLIVGAGTAVFLAAVIMIVASDHIARNTALRLGVALGALVLGDAVRSRRELHEANHLDPELMRLHAVELGDTARSRVSCRAAVGDEALDRPRRSRRQKSGKAVGVEQVRKHLLPVTFVEEVPQDEQLLFLGIERPEIGQMWVHLSPRAIILLSWEGPAR